MTSCSSSETPTYSNWLRATSLFMVRIHKRKLQLCDCWKFSNLILDIFPPASSLELSIWPPHTSDHSKRYMLVIASLKAINTQGDMKGPSALECMLELLRVSLHIVPHKWEFESSQLGPFLHKRLGKRRFVF